MDWLLFQKNIFTEMEGDLVTNIDPMRGIHWETTYREEIREKSLFDKIKFCPYIH